MENHHFQIFSIGNTSSEGNFHRYRRIICYARGLNCVVFAQTWYVIWEWCWVLILHGHRKLLFASSQWQEQCNVLLDQNGFSIRRFFYFFFLKKYAWQALTKKWWQSFELFRNIPDNHFKNIWQQFVEFFPQQKLRDTQPPRQDLCIFCWHSPIS